MTIEQDDQFFSGGGGECSPILPINAVHNPMKAQLQQPPFLAGMDDHLHENSCQQVNASDFLLSPNDGRSQYLTPTVQ